MDVSPIQLSPEQAASALKAKQDAFYVKLNALQEETGMEITAVLRYAKEGIIPLIVAYPKETTR